MIVDGILEPMELAHLPYRNGKTYEDYVGLRGLKRLGRRKWERHVGKVVAELRAALEPEQIVLGGGNAKKLKELPPGTIRGNNQNALREGSGCGAKINESRNNFETKSKSQSGLEHRVRHDPEQPSRTQEHRSRCTGSGVRSFLNGWQQR
jgi:hypothetical protein